MHDLKFEEAVRIGKSFSPEHINMFPECEKEARIFTASIASAKALLIVPGFAMAFGAMNQHCKEWADREVVKSGKLFASKEEMIEYVADLGGDRMGDAADGFLQNQEAYLQAASADLYDYAKITPRIMTALEDSLKAVVILTWTAVEVLIQDLWKNAQSKVPVIFVTPTEKERNGKNNISGELKKMGFISRSAFRNIYAWSFRVDNAEILSRVGDLALDNLSLRACLKSKSCGGFAVWQAWRCRHENVNPTPAT